MIIGHHSHVVVRVLLLRVRVLWLYITSVINTVTLQPQTFLNEFSSNIPNKDMGSSIITIKQVFGACLCLTYAVNSPLLTSIVGNMQINLPKNRSSQTRGLKNSPVLS